MLTYQYLVLPYVLAIFLFGACVAQAQEKAGSDSSGMQQRMAQLQQAAAHNEAQLHTYQWIESTTITLNGKSRPPRQSACSFGADGKMIKVPMTEDVPPEVSGGPLKRHMMEKKIAEAREEMQQIQQTTALYLPLDHAALHNAMSSKPLSLEHNGPGGDAVIIHDYAKPGDQIRVNLDIKTMQILSITLSSYLDNPQDTLVAQVAFARLDDGTVYPSVTTLTAAQRKISISTSSSYFTKVVH
ncbi:MAG: hypothetical protein PW735_07135 [Acidobacteriaceae bacterium]|nr:hypothetical protein [Acidobacteriaceae bacterium]